MIMGVRAPTNRKMAGIFKAYDIRGLVEKELSEELAYRIGRAFVLALKLQGKTILVGHDMRKTSVPYSDAVIKGVTDEGANVIDAGLVSSPLFYFATKDYDAGIMVTASHNPTEYNGFKLCREQAIPVNYDTGIGDIEQRMPTLGEPVGEKGTVQRKDFLQGFLAFSNGFLNTTKPFKVVVDAGNGMGGHTYGAAIELLKEKNVEVIPMYFELDDSFPNHEANPLDEETHNAIRKKVVEEGADLGILIDGDGDRCVFIDEQGMSIGADLTLALIAAELLENHPGATILYDLRCSRVVRETVETKGGKAIMTRVGHTFIKAHMRNVHGLFAGEVSGHFYPSECNYTENTMYTLFMILNLLERTGKSLSELIKPLRKYAFSGEINSKVEDPDAKISAVTERFGKGATVTDIDGTRIEHPSWWALVRKSNTEPLLRLIVEADTQQEMEQRRDELLAVIRN